METNPLVRCFMPKSAPERVGTGRDGKERDDKGGVTIDVSLDDDGVNVRQKQYMGFVRIIFLRKVAEKASCRVCTSHRGRSVRAF